jgi:tetratricopeptide (TPR) repeat protein
VKRSYKIKIAISIAGFLLSAQITVHSQPKPTKVYEPADAREHYQHQNYLMALNVYKELLKTDPANEEYNHRIGICYLRTNVNKPAAIPYLEKVSKNPKADPEVWLDLGKAYHYANKFDEAVKAYNKYKQLLPKEAAKVDRQIEMCNNGKQLIKFPLNVEFENLGKEVNSEFPDYYPFVTDDESTLLFTSRKSGNIGNQLEVDGYYSSDIYISTAKNGVWQKPRNIGPPINTRLDEQVVGLTADGTKMFVYLDHIDSLGNIYISEKKAASYGKEIKLNNNVNSGLETSGCIAPSGDIIFFASQRDGGLGETDIYMARKLPNGQWALPQNLGPNINTKYKEDFPRMASDGKTLYFSSQGHSSMGDFDLFKSEWDEENNTWSAPKNLGYPLNTADDDRQISITSDQRAAYVSRAREGGMGDLDLYRVTFKDDEAIRYTIVSGTVLTGDTTAAGRKVEAIITATNSKTPDDQPLTFTPIPNSGKYVMALPPGKWVINIEATGFKPYVDTIVLFDLGSFQPEMKKDFPLVKQ